MRTLTFLLVMGWAMLGVGAVRSEAQTFTTLYTFCTNGSCVDGVSPNCLVAGMDGNLYGTCAGGGTNGAGTAFKLTTEGTLTRLYTFCNTVVCPTLPTEPNGFIQGSDGNFYGTTAAGGEFNGGAVFKMTSQGTLTTLYSFCGLTNSGFCADGNEPEASVIEGSDGNFYGTTKEGGLNDFGTIFRLTPQGTLTTLYSFMAETDGSQPSTSLVEGSNSNFYGTAHYEGAGGGGSVFEITSQGTFTTIYSFCTSTNRIPCYDGTGPDAPLIAVGNNLLGTTDGGGINNITESGSVFEMPLGGLTNGALVPLYSFCSVDGAGCVDGSFPTAGLTYGSDSNFYGTTSEGGVEGRGTVFQLTPGGILTTLHSFCSDSVSGECLDGMMQGAARGAAVVQATNGKFYGVTPQGGSSGNGVVFQLDMGLAGTGGGGSTNCNYAINPTNAVDTAAGGSATVSVTASNGCAWTATSNNGFITITAGSAGSGNGTVHYTVAPNASTNSLAGTLTIAGETFTVTESGTTSSGGCTFTLSATSVTLASKGGAKNVSVKTKGTDCAWTAVSNDPFITITSGSTGSGAGKVDYTVAGNTNTTALSGTLTIAGQTFTVNQASGGCMLSLSPKDAKPKAAGGTATVKVKANLSDCTWTAVSNDPFIEITDGASGTGNGTVSYSVAANTNSTPVSGSITIGAQTFTITQSGAK